MFSVANSSCPDHNGVSNDTKRVQYKSYPLAMTRKKTNACLRTCGGESAWRIHKVTLCGFVADLWSSRWSVQGRHKVLTQNCLSATLLGYDTFYIPRYAFMNWQISEWGRRVINKSSNTGYPLKEIIPHPLWQDSPCKVLLPIFAPLKRIIISD